MFQYYPPPAQINEISSWQYTNSNNFSPRSLISANSAPEPHRVSSLYSSGVQSFTTEQINNFSKQGWMPAVLLPVVGNAPLGSYTYEVKEENKTNVDYERSRKPKPKSIMKQLQKEEWESSERDYDAPVAIRRREIVREIKPSVLETVNTTEESKHTEELERRVSATDKRKKKHGHGLHNRSYLTHTVHSHHPRRSEHDFFSESTHSPRRHDSALEYGGRHSGEEIYRNGFRDDFRTHSSRDVYGTLDDYGTGPRPIVEYPPTLPRSEDHYGDRSVRRSHSANDWSLQPRFYQDMSMMNRNFYDEDTTGLEREFRDTLLMPLPRGQNINEREFREEKIPGGHESFSKEVKANSGSRQNHPNEKTFFDESKQEISFNREQTFNR